MPACLAAAPPVFKVLAAYCALLITMPADFVFEVSSEAGRKIGGIYTVLQSKAPYFVQKFKENYLLIGFYDKTAEASEFQPEAPPAAWAKVFNELRPLGIDCYYGRWLNGANARIVYVDARHYGERQAEFEGAQGLVRDTQLNAVKFWLWKQYGVDSLMMGWDFNESVPWGHAVGLLLEKLLALPEFKGKKVAGHFHEWLAGAALLYARYKNLPIATVFTTHATVLGRSLTSVGRDVLTEARRAGEGRVDLHEAYNLKVEGKHLLEAACATNADAFTTVSDTVAEEVRYILGKEPDVVVPNGISFEAFKEKRKLDTLGRYVRSELEEFIESYFAPYYDFRYEDSLLVYIAGRYEFRNKGFDIFIKALGKLNDALKIERKPRRIVALIFAPSSVKGPRTSVLHNYLLMDKIHEFVGQLEGADAAKCHVAEIAAKCKPSTAVKVRGMLQSFKRENELPPVSAYELTYPNDAIETACRVAGLDNSPDDVVKVIFYPTYVRAGDGLLDMDYYDILSGTDVGVFPSRYEPFGYTPVEAAANLNVAITSDATGFGRLIEGKVKTLKGRGMRVVAAVGKGDEEVTNDLATELRDLYYTTPKGLQRLKEDAFKLVRLCDWAKLVTNYYSAQDFALRRLQQRMTPPATAPAAKPQQAKT